MQHSLRYCTWQQTGSSGWPLDGAATTALLLYRPIAAKTVACNVCNFGNIWTLILLEYRKYFGRQKVVKLLWIYKVAQTKTTYDLQPRLDELLKRPLSKHSSSSGGKFQWQPIIFSNHGMLSVCRAKLENGTSFLRYSQNKKTISKKSNIKKSYVFVLAKCIRPIDLCIECMGRGSLFCWFDVTRSIFHIYVQKWLEEMEFGHNSVQKYYYYYYYYYYY